MNDPFRPEANPQLMREARIGLALLAITLGLFSYVAYYKIMGSGSELPEHVLNAPVAMAVWPGEDPPELAKSQKAEPKPVAHQFGSLLASARNSLGIGTEKTRKKLFEPQKDYSDPVPAQKAERLPVIATPERAVPAALEMADVERAAAKRTVDDSFVASFDAKSKPLKMPIDTNELRRMTAPQTAAKRIPTTEFEPNHIGHEDNTTRLANHTTLASQNEFVQREISPSQFKPIRPLVNAESISSSSDKGSNQFAGNIEVEPAQSSKAVTSDIASTFAPESDALRRTDVSHSNSLESTFVSNANPRSDSVSGSGTSIDSKVHPSNSSVHAIEVVTEDPVKSNEHTVLAGESFWSIAQQQYDDGRYFRALYEYNQKRVGSFENLAPGAVIATPAASELAKLWPDLCPKPDGSAAESTDVNERVYVTREGDTLFEIARQKLDQASRYLEIMEMNQFALPQGVNHLSPLVAGTRLVLPLSVN